MSIRTLTTTLISLSLCTAVMASHSNDDNYTQVIYDQNPNQSMQSSIPTYNNYIGGNIGFLKIETISSELNSLQSKYPLTYAGFIGHQISKHLALEAGYGYATVDSSEQATFNFPYATTKIIIPVSDAFDLYAKLGLAYVSVSSKTQPDASGHYPIPYLGLGADFNVLPHLAINLDAAGPSIGVVGLYAVSGGLAFKF